MLNQTNLLQYNKKKENFKIQFIVAIDRKLGIKINLLCKRSLVQSYEILHYLHILVFSFIS